MCQLCETQPVYEFTNKRKVCARCFINYFQKKFLYTLKKFGMIKRGEVIGYKVGKNFRDVVLEDVLNMFGDKSFVEVVKLPSRNVNVVAVSDTIDVNSFEIINDLIKGKAKLEKVKRVEKKIIKPLYLFLDEEVLLYAKLKGLKFVKKVDKNDKINNFIEELEKKHPEVKRAVINSYLELYNL